VASSSSRSSHLWTWRRSLCTSRSCSMNAWYSGKWTGTVVGAWGCGRRSARASADTCASTYLTLPPRYAGHPARTRWPRRGPVTLCYRKASRVVDRVVDRESLARCAASAFRDKSAAISAGSVPGAACRASRNA
jgi:hypothetical protein